MRYLILVLALLFSQVGAYSQREGKKPLKKEKENLFKFGVIGGIVRSQIDGDFYSGFNKTGYLGGLKGEVNLHKYIAFEVNLAYSSLGSVFPSARSFQSNKFSRSIDLKYAEVPFLVNLKIPKKNFDLQFEMGFGLMQVLDAKVVEDNASRLVQDFGTTVDQFNNRQMGGILGLEFAHKNISLSFRLVNSITKLYYNEQYYTNISKGKSNGNMIGLLRNYYYAVLVSYNLFNSTPK